jgi:hypothetical protein
MRKILLFFSFLFILSCTKGDLPLLVTTSITSTPAITQYKLTVSASQGGWVNFGETSLRRRDAYYIFRPAGTEVTVSATSADGYIFSGWSNGWTANPITFELNSDVTFYANFTNTND